MNTRALMLVSIQLKNNDVVQIGTNLEDKVIAGVRVRKENNRYQIMDHLTESECMAFFKTYKGTMLPGKRVPRFIKRIDNHMFIVDTDQFVPHHGGSMK